MVRGICVRPKAGRASSRNTDERKSDDATERSELYEGMS